MISSLKFLVNDLAAVHTVGNGWLRDMNWGEFLRARQGKKGALGLDEAQLEDPPQ